MHYRRINTENKSAIVYYENKTRRVLFVGSIFGNNEPKNRVIRDLHARDLKTNTTNVIRTSTSCIVNTAYRRCTHRCYANYLLYQSSYVIGENKRLLRGFFFILTVCIKFERFRKSQKNEYSSKYERSTSVYRHGGFEADVFYVRAVKS